MTPSDINEHWPPVSSRTTIKSTPSATSFFKVEASTNLKCENKELLIFHRDV